jgi:hypothetical protein
LEQLEKDILTVVSFGFHNLYLIAMSLQEDYDIVEISKHFYRLKNKGFLKYDENYRVVLTIEGERQMTKTTKTNRSEAARKAHETRRRNAEKRSQAARKAWATRRAGAQQKTTTDRSAAAQKAWETRRSNAETTQTTSDTVRSNAAKKAWETRRARALFEKRSEAARKAWRTRKANAVVRRRSR